MTEQNAARGVALQERDQTTDRGTGTDTFARPAGQDGALAQSTDAGTTRISESVVAKIAGLAARDIPGVHSMGRGLERRVGQLRSMVPGGDSATAPQGVSVQIDNDTASVDLDIVTWYGQSIIDISDTVRRNVIGQVEGMTGLRVNQVNVQVNDIHLDTDPSSRSSQSSHHEGRGRGQRHEDHRRHEG